VASCMGMYDLIPAGMEGAITYGLDGSFWTLLSYCAGVGGSILIIGSAAGVVVMGLQKISFGWYMKNISWMALLGYFAGIAAFWLQSFIF
jgi:Na+/H+ antiporter NhaD/arsenite permease-like protein